MPELYVVRCSAYVATRDEPCMALFPAPHAKFVGLCPACRRKYHRLIRTPRQTAQKIRKISQKPSIWQKTPPINGTVPPLWRIK